MNLKMIRYILGAVMVIIGVFMLASCLVALYYREQVGLIYLGVAAGSILLGILFKWKKPANTTIYLKEGCVATALSWVLMSAIGALPFFISREIPKITDAVPFPDHDRGCGFNTCGVIHGDDIVQCTGFGGFHEIRERGCCAEVGLLGTHLAHCPQECTG